MKYCWSEQVGMSVGAGQIQHGYTCFDFVADRPVGRGVVFVRANARWRKRKRRTSVLVCGLGNNHGHSRTALTNVRVDSGLAERKRGASALVSGLFKRHKACVIEFCCARAADIGSGLIKRKALGAGDAGHVWPATGRPATGRHATGRLATGPGSASNRGEHEEQAVCAGFKIAARRFVLGREAVCEKHDERQALVKGCAGNLLLAWADAWRNEHRAALGGIKEARLFGGECIGGDASRALNLEPVRAVEQEWVAVGGESVAHEGKLIYACEIVGVGEAHRQPARVVADVAKESFQLPLVGEYPVVIAWGEEGRCAPCMAHNRTGLRTGLVWWSAIHGAIHGAIRLCAAHLEAAHHLAQMTGHAAAHEKQPVKVIWHYGAFQKLHFGVEERDLPPAFGDGFAKRRGGDPFANELAEQRATPRHFERDHVDAALEVVVAEASALHGMTIRDFHLPNIIPNCQIAGKEAA